MLDKFSKDSFDFALKFNNHREIEVFKDFISVCEQQNKSVAETLSELIKLDSNKYKFTEIESKVSNLEQRVKDLEKRS